MSLHLPTLFTLVAAGAAMLAILLAIAQQGPLRDELAIRDWSRGSWALAVSYAAILGREWLPLPVSLLVGNLGSELALTFYASALHRFLRGGPPPRWLWSLLGSQALVLLLVLPAEQATRVTLVTASHVLLVLPSLWWLHRAGQRPESLMRAVSVTLMIAEACLVFRLLDSILYPDLYMDALAGGWRQSVAYVAAYIFLLGSGYGFALAHLERSVRRLQHMAHTDALTGCLNRRAADARFEAMLIAAQQAGRSVALLLLDLDHFKRINDGHGHRSGDLALQQVAAAARAQLPGDQPLARLGGEEFGLMLPDCDAAAARRCAEGLRAAVQALEVHDETGQRLGLTVSVGVAVAVPPGAEDPQRLLAGLFRRADEALYQAKALGRNRVECAEAEVTVVVASA